MFVLEKFKASLMSLRLTFKHLISPKKFPKQNTVAYFAAALTMKETKFNNVEPRHNLIKISLPIMLQ